MFLGDQPYSLITIFFFFSWPLPIIRNIILLLPEFFYNEPIFGKFYLFIIKCDGKIHILLSAISNLRFFHGVKGKFSYNQSIHFLKFAALSTMTDYCILLMGALYQNGILQSNSIIDHHNSKEISPNFAYLKKLTFFFYLSPKLNYFEKQTCLIINVSKSFANRLCRLLHYL